MEDSIYEKAIWDEFVEWYHKQVRVSLDIETNVTDKWNEFNLISVQVGGCRFGKDRIQWFFQWSELDEWQKLELKELLEDDTVEKLAHHVRFEAIVLLFHGIRIDHVYDTMLAEKVLRGGMDTGEYKLADLSWKYLRQFMNKEQQSNFGDNIMTDEKILYACTDVLCLDIIQRLQIEEADREQLLNVFALEMESVLGFSDMSYEGMILELVKWRENILLAEPLVAEAKEKLDGWLLKPPFYEHAVREGYISENDRVTINFDAPLQRTELLQLMFPDIPGGSMPIVKAYIRNNGPNLSSDDLELLLTYQKQHYAAMEERLLWYHKSYLISKGYLIPAGQVTINWGSPVQVLGVLKQQFPRIKDTSAETLSELSHGIIAALFEYRENLKLINDLGENFIRKHLCSDGKVRTSFNQVMSTGRLCIEENQIVTLVGGYKPIKDVEVGDMVYCYDEEGQLRIRRVLSKTNNGMKPVVKVKWQSSGNGSCGELICTPDHRIKTKNYGWVEAQHLNRYDKLYHLRRDDNHITGGGHIRPRLYGTNSLMEVEQSIIKREWFNGKSRDHAHHKDENTANNSVGNIEILTHSEHTSLHSKKMWAEGKGSVAGLLAYEHIPVLGKDNPNWIPKTKYQLLRMLMQAGGRPTYAEMDFETYKRKCVEEGINLSEVCKRFNNEGVFINRGTIRKVAVLQQKARLELTRLGYYRVEEIKRYYGIENHAVTSVTSFGEAIVYDLEVEGLNNFIASEICVHNSSSHPNMQNVVVKKSVGTRYRNAFIAPPGWMYVSGDYVSQELVEIAYISREPAWLEAIDKGQDLHSVSAEVVLGHKWRDAAEEGKCEFYFAHVDKKGVFHGADSKVKCSCKKHEVMRADIKSVNFLLAYGGTEYKLSNELGIPLKEAKALIKLYFSKLPNIDRMFRFLADFTLKNGFSMTLAPFFRKRWFPYWANNKYYLKEHVLGIRYNKALGEIEKAGKNHTIQGSAADITKVAVVLIRRYIRENNLWDRVKMVCQVHDQIDTICVQEYAEEWKPKLEELMVEAGKLIIPSGILQADVQIAPFWTK